MSLFDLESDSFEQDIQVQIKQLMSQRHYPCVAALKSFHQKDYWVRCYSQFGDIYQRPQLRNDLLNYLNEYQKSKSEYFTFWAVFKDTQNLTENEFEEKLWQELSALTSQETKNLDSDPEFSSDPEDKKFCFSLGGKAFFVVGLHPNSSRISRRFPWPTLIFNVYDQFKDLATAGLYQPMVVMNRKRDILYQGDINPMVAEHNDDWEAIQFSGQKNPSTWKCPFHFRNSAKES